MNGGFVLEGVKIILIVLAGTLTIGLMAYLLFKRSTSQNKQSFYQTAPRKKNLGILQELPKDEPPSSPKGQMVQGNKTVNEIEDFRGRLERLERVVAPGKNQQEIENILIQHGRQKAESDSADDFIEDLADDFIEDMIKFLETYRNSKRKSVSPETGNIVGQKSLPTSILPEKEYRLINDMNLIRWWRENGYNNFSVCQESLQGEFGDVYVERIDEGLGEGWNLIGVGKDRVEFYVLPRRKDGWDEQCYQDWFALKEGIVRPGTPINSLIPPLPKAQKLLSEWHRVGEKGTLSISEDY